MSRLSWFNLLVLAGTFVYVGLVGLVVYGYSRATSLEVAQEVPKEAAKEAVPQVIEPKADDLKKEEPRKEDPPPRVEIRRQFAGGFRVFPKRSKSTSLSERLGIRVDAPNEETIVQLGLAEGSGLVIAEVRENSAAGGAGLKVGDILLELAGRNVPGDPMNFDFQFGDLKTSEPIEVAILREGKMETLKGLIVPAPAPRTFQFPRNPD
jgi:S1-C subfamily serine protease